MQSQAREKTAGTLQGRMFWALIITLAAAQLMAFWMLCTDQVRKAEVRDATLHEQKLALADCLRYVPKATLSSCASQSASSAPATTAVLVSGGGAAQNNAAARPVMGAAVPVSFSLR